MKPETAKKIKRIVAREGLVLFGFIFAGSINGIICSKIPFPEQIPQPPSGFTLDNFFVRHSDFFHYTLSSLLFFGYLFYLLIRFTIWAVKTLKEK